MSNFTPGAIIKHFQTKNGHTATIRYPGWQDITQYVAYTNRLSAEDTYVAFSGESVTYDEQTTWMARQFVAMEMGDLVELVCTVEGHIVSIATLERAHASRLRSRHLGQFGISVAAGYRSHGIGREMIATSIDEAKRRIDDLRLVELSVFAVNTKAIRLYQALGFRQTGRIPSALLYKSEYIDELTMCLELDRKKWSVMIQEADRRLFNAVRDRTRRVEVRAASMLYTSIKVGDILEYFCGEDRLERHVRAVTTYKSLPDVVKDYPPRLIMPGARTLAQLENTYYSFPGYRQKITKHGLIAFELA